MSLASIERFVATVTVVSHDASVRVLQKAGLVFARSQAGHDGVGGVAVDEEEYVREVGLEP